MIDPTAFRQLSETLGSNRLKNNVPLVPHTTFGIGGPAELFYEARTDRELIGAMKAAHSLKIPYFILGGGSNILIADQGITGLTIKIQNQKLEVKDNRIIAKAGTPLSKIVKAARDNALSGLECCMGIPGTIGGAVISNAGSKKEWIGQNVETITILDENAKIIKLKKEECGFKYRDSRFKHRLQEIILEISLRLTSQTKEKIAEKEKNFLQERSGQPQEKSAGSVFKNPPGDFAGRLIDVAGLKGKRIGEAQISSQHANFIINLGNARADDVYALIKLAQETVKEKFGVKLELEIKLVGFK